MDIGIHGRCQPRHLRITSW